MKIFNVTVLCAVIGVFVNQYFLYQDISKIRGNVTTVISEVGIPDYPYQETAVKISGKNGGHGSGVVVKTYLNKSLVITNKHVCEGINPVNEMKEDLNALKTLINSLPKKCKSNKCVLKNLGEMGYIILNSILDKYNMSGDLNNSVKELEGMIEAEQNTEQWYPVVQTYTNVKMKGRVLRMSKNYDLCLMEVDRGNLTTVKFRLLPPVLGEPLVNIGNPHDMVNHKVSGFVGKTDVLYENEYFSNSAPIFPGNSGGGAYDKNGYLLGINTLGHQYVVTFGYSIPFMQVQEFLSEGKE